MDELKEKKEGTDSDLPFGWEEGETASGQKYFINHETKTTHWKHPRLILEEKRLEFEQKQKDVEKKALVCPAEPLVPCPVCVLTLLTASPF